MTSRRFLFLIVVARVVASGWFSVNLPLWERADELQHYLAARVIAFGHRLPSTADADAIPADLRIFTQYTQPPLYYLLIAPIVRLFDQPSLSPIYPNAIPHCLTPRFNDYLHLPYERFPPSGSALGAWVARGITLLLGAAAVVLVWEAARGFFPHQPKLAPFAASLFAFMPASLEISATLNNDSLLLAVGALVLALLARIWREGLNWKRGVAVCAALILCLMTKLTGASMAVPVVFVLARRVNRRQLLLLVALIGVALGAFAIYNVSVCGQPVCRVHRFEFVFDTLDHLAYSLRPNYFIEGLIHLANSLTVPSLHPAIMPPLWMQGVLLAVFVLGLFGSLPVGYNRWPLRLLWLTILASLVVGLLRVWWLQVGYLPARYLAAVLPALALLIAFGTLQLLYSLRLPQTTALISPGVFALCALLTPVLMFQPGFAPPQSPDTPMLPVSDYDFASGLQITGFTVSDNNLTLEMTSNRQLNAPLFVQVSLLNEQGNVLETCGLTAGSAWSPSVAWLPGIRVIQQFPFALVKQASAMLVDSFWLDVDYLMLSKPGTPDPRVRGTIIDLRQ